MSEDMYGAPTETASGSDIKPTLDGVGADFAVKVFNPLSKPFNAKFARSVVQSPRMNEQELRHQQRMAELGIPLQKDQPITNVVQYYVIPAGATKVLPGDIAQVVVRQLVNTILQLRNAGQNSNQLADPYARQQVEKEVVSSYKPIMQSINENPEDIISRQIDELNNPEATQVEEQIDEQEFPELTRDTSEGDYPVPEGSAEAAPASGTGATYTPKRGRPAKAEA